MSAGSSKNVRRESTCPNTPPPLPASSVIPIPGCSMNDERVSLVPPTASRLLCDTARPARTCAYGHELPAPNMVHLGPAPKFHRLFVNVPPDTSSECRAHPASPTNPIEP